MKIFSVEDFPLAGGITYNVNDKPPTRSICDLREAIGWDRNEGDYPAALQRYDATVSAYDEGGNLIGWCTVITDGIRHGFFVDVIVHPQWRRQGIGSSLIKAAIADLKMQGITLIHADFAKEHAAFHRHCGFHIGGGGFIEL